MVLIDPVPGHCLLVGFKKYFFYQVASLNLSSDSQTTK